MVHVRKCHGGRGYAGAWSVATAHAGHVRSWGQKKITGDEIRCLNAHLQNSDEAY